MNLSTIDLCLDADVAIDPQLYTTYSNGRWTPEQLFDYLLSEQFGLAAITDTAQAASLARHTSRCAAAISYDLTIDN